MTAPGKVIIQKPSQGRVVIYTDEHGDKFVAFIDKFVGGVNVDGKDTGGVNLLVIMNRQARQVFEEFDVKHDDAQAPNTWRFPKHEAETIEVAK